jgi:hydrogenase-4 membrane subunit HyfE
VIQQWQKRVLQAVLTLVVVAASARLVWALLEPAIPVLVSLAVVLVVLGVAVFGRRSK